MSQAKKKKRKERPCQQGNPCLRELRKKFASGASTMQTSTIRLRRRSLVGVRRVLERAISSFLVFFNILLVFMIFVAY